MKPSSLNHTFRLVWSDAQGAYVPVPETVSARGKKSRSALGLAAALAVASLASVALPAAAAPPLNPPAANALPTGGQVTSGSATISQSGNTLNINQSSAKMIANWGSFDIGKDAKVNFIQPNASSQALNRITGQNPSQIFGQLNANGQVVLINPNGIVFGQGAQVNVGGLVASTLQLSDADFHNGQLRFTQGNGAGSIVNQGSLNGQVIALIAPQVSNQGSIVANSGSAVLASGNQVTLDFAGNGMVNVKVDEGTFNALVENKALIQADGGLVFMTAKTADTLMATVVNNEGTIQARTLDTRSGRILLMGDMHNGRTDIAGTLDASAPNGGNGGFIETSAAQVKIANNTQVTTAAPQGQSGTWLIDPTDFTISAGTGVQTTSGIGASTLQTALGSGSVTLASSDGDVNVNAAVSWSANTLTLNAGATSGNVNINALMTATGSAGLSLNPGTSGSVNTGMNVNTPNVFTGRVEFSGSGGLQIGGQTYTVIRDATALQNINSGRSGKYVLGTTIDLNNAAFTPIGNYTSSTQASDTTEFSGKFNGLGNLIKNISITGTATNDGRSDNLGVGLFGGIKGGATISNVGLLNVDVNQSTTVGIYTTSKSAGALVGRVNAVNANVQVSNVYAAGAGKVAGEQYVGGLIGWVKAESLSAKGSVTINNIFSSISINVLQPSDNTRTASFIGGLIGALSTGAGTDPSIDLRNAYSTGNISGLTMAAISGQGVVGGLVGESNGLGAIRAKDVYATGNVSLGSGTVTNAGGLFGRLIGSTLTNAYATGVVSGGVNNGGLIGLTSSSTIVDGFYNASANSGLKGIAGVNDVAGRVYGLSSADLKVKANFTSATTANGNNAAAWDFEPATGAWGMKAGKNNDYPVLCYFYGGACATKLTISLADTTKNFGDANPTLGSYTITSGTLNTGDSLGASFSWGTAPKATNQDLVPGSYGYATTNLLNLGFTTSVTGNSISDYVIDWGGKGLTVTARPITVTTAAQTRVYGAANPATGNVSITSGSLASGDAATLTGRTLTTAATATSNAGGSYTVNAGTLSLTTGTASNYAITYVDGPLTITPKALNLSVGKTYDGTPTFSSAFVLTGMVNGNSAPTVSGTADVASKDAATYTSFATNSLSLSNSNYTLTGGTVSATINKKALALTGLTVTSRAYDGTRSAVLAGTAGVDNGGSSATDGKAVGSEIVTLNGTPVGTYDTANVGTGKAVAITGLTLSDATNYTLGASLTGDISKKTVASISATKTYNGNTTLGAGTVTIDTGVTNGGSTETLTYSGASANSAHVGAGNFISALTLQDGSGLASNYQLPTLDATNAPVTINAKTLTPSITGAPTKLYDGNTNATLGASNFSLNGLVGSESFTVNKTTGSFNSKDVLGASSVSTSLASSDLTAGSGTLASDYVLSGTATGAASITPRTVSLSGTKVYDGGTSLGAGAVTIGTGVSGESLGYSGATVNNANVATSNKYINAITLTNGTGGTASNYQLPTLDVAHAPVTIDKRTLTINGSSAADKTYDGNTNATITTGTLGNLVTGQTITVTAVGTFDSKNAGSRTATAVYTLASGSGGDASNYQLADTTHSATINKKALTITGTTAADKTYDGNTVAAITQGTLSGFVGSETVTSSVVGTFDSKNAGARTATAAYTLANGTNGGLADNYQLADTTHSATVAVRNLNVKGITAENKVYNGNTEAKLVLASASLENTVVGDDIAVVTDAAKGNFLDANVKNDKKVVITGLRLSGAEVNNYAIATYDDMLANITPQPSGAVTALTSPQNAINGTSDRPVAGGNPIMPGAGTVATVSLDRNALIVDNTSKTMVTGGAPMSTNASLLRIPSQGSMVLSSETGNRSIALTAAGNVTTLSMSGAGNPANTTPTVTTPALPVFKGVNTAAAGTEAAVVVSDQGSSLSATKATMSETGMTAGAALESASKVSASMPSAKATIAMADGSAASMTVAVTAEGVLVVRMPAGAAQEGNESAVTLLAIAAAKENLSVTTDALRGVLILPSQ